MEIVHPMKFWLWGNLNTGRRRRRWDSSLSNPRSLLCGCPELQPRRMCRRMGAPSITHSWGCLWGHSLCCPGSLKASFGITRGQGRPANASWGWGIRQQVSSPCRLSAILFLFLKMWENMVWIFFVLKLALFVSKVFPFRALTGTSLLLLFIDSGIPLNMTRMRIPEYLQQPWMD